MLYPDKGAVFEARARGNLTARFAIVMAGCKVQRRGLWCHCPLANNAYVSPDQAASKDACILRQTFRKEQVVTALAILPTAALPLIRCLCKSWCVIYQAEYHNTEEGYCPQLCTCMGWGLGFVSVFCFVGFFAPNNTRGLWVLVFWVFFSLCYLYKRLLSCERYVCVEECFVAGIWNLNFLVSSNFLIFLGWGLSHIVLIPIRCFSHVLSIFFLPCGILLENSSLKKNVTFQYINSEVPSGLRGNIYDHLFAQMEHRNQFSM